MPTLEADKEEPTSGKCVPGVSDNGSITPEAITNTPCDQGLAVKPTSSIESPDATVKAQESESFDNDKKDGKNKQAVGALSDDNALHADTSIQPTHPDVVARHHEALRQAVQAGTIF